tara:strand:- start:17924 stop:18205 length:282 start_codon:yes stop_codon:yes gene_type:complete
MARTASSDSVDDPLAIAFGKALKRHREAAGLTMPQLGKKIGRQRSYIWRVEHGQSLPNLRTAAHLAAGLGIPLSELLAGVDLEGISSRDRSAG